MEGRRKLEDDEVFGVFFDAVKNCGYGELTKLEFKTEERRGVL